MKSSNKPTGWRLLKARLEEYDRKELLALIRELYEAGATNREFLEARLLEHGRGIEEYRHLIREAVFPDPFSRRPIRIRDASTMITEFRQATGNLPGTVDLMLTFVEAGTAQAADFGYGEDGYFAAMEKKVDEVLKLLPMLPAKVQAEAGSRLVRIRDRGACIGWGYGDRLQEAVERLPPDLQRPIQERQ